MTSDNVQYPIGTIVREDHKHTDGTDGHTTWALVEDYAAHSDLTEVYPTWIVLFSTSPGNLSETLPYAELPLDAVEVIGTVPGTPAAEQAAAETEKVIKGDYPRITWGTKPDGSPWAVHVDFGSGVAINSTGDLWDNKRVITAAQADRKSIVLRDAMAWVVNDLVSIVEGNKAHQLATGEQPKRKPRSVRIGVDRSGWMHKHQPDSSHVGLPWVRMDGVGRHTDKGMIELTDADSITVTATNTSSVAAFLDGKLVPARNADDIAGVEIGREYIGLWPMTKIWKTEGRFYILRKGANLTIPVSR